MKKPVFAMLLGGVLGVFDGLTALVSAPQEAPNIVGIVIGSTFKGVIAGLVIGGVTGALMGKGLDLGMDEKFKGQVGDLLKEPGTSALMFVARKMTPDKVLEELKPYGGTVLRTSLSHDDEEKLVEALKSA